MLWFVDIFKEKLDVYKEKFVDLKGEVIQENEKIRYEEGIIIYEIDIKNNSINEVIKLKNHFDKNIALKLIELVEEKRPRQIIFEKSSFGIGVYERFIKEIDRVEDIIMLEDGRLFYN